MMDKVNVVVIGCGSFGREHLRVLSEMEDVQIIGVCDINREVAKRYSQKIRCSWTDDVNLIPLWKPDAVDIVTPTITHEKIIRGMLANDISIFVEKPMCASAEEARDIVQFYEKTCAPSTMFMVGFIESFNPAVKKAAQMIEDGEIGEILSISTQRLSEWPIRVGDVDVITDLAIHDIDLLLSLFRVRRVLVYATGGKHRHKFVDYANILLTFPGNRPGSIEVNWFTPKKTREMRITGTKGLIHVHFIDQMVTLMTNDGIWQPSFNKVEPLKEEMRNWIDSLKRGVHPHPSEQEGWNALIVVEAALKSIKSKNPVEVILQ